LDYDAFSNELAKDLKGPLKERLLSVLKVYLIEDEFKDICERLLLLLKDSDLLRFMYHLAPLPQAKPSSLDSFINDFLLCYCKWETLDELLLYNAIVNHPKQILRFMEEKESMKEKLGSLTDDSLSHWVLRKELVESGSKKEQARFALLQFWLLASKLLAFVNEREAMEAVMEKERISFEPIFVPSYQSEGKHSSKRKRVADDGIFIGWKLGSQLRGTSSTVYSIADTAVYLAQNFLYQLIQELVPKK